MTDSVAGVVHFTRTLWLTDAARRSVAPLCSNDDLRARRVVATPEMEELSPSWSIASPNHDVHSTPAKQKGRPPA
jgi:hypothetical protein